MPDANTKYKCAWSEINIRIQARDRVFHTFISLTAILVGISLSKDELAFTAIGVGYLALGASLIILQHDLVISYLASFQRDVAENDGLDSKIPEWMSDEYIEIRWWSRHIRSASHILFIIFGAIPALYISSASLNEKLEIKMWLWIGSLGCSIGAVIIFVIIAFSRSRLVRRRKTSGK